MREAKNMELVKAHQSEDGRLVRGDMLLRFKSYGNVVQECLHLKGIASFPLTLEAISYPLTVVI